MLFINQNGCEYGTTRNLLCFLCGEILVRQSALHTVCLESSDPFYIVSYYIKWATTSWTHSRAPSDGKGLTWLFGQTLFSPLKQSCGSGLKLTGSDPPLKNGSGTVLFKTALFFSFFIFYIKNVEEDIILLLLSLTIDTLNSQRTIDLNGIFLSGSKCLDRIRNSGQSSGFV